VRRGAFVSRDRFLWNQLLERLESMPLRQAFTRLQGYFWVGMLRESGQVERWRDMARATEGIRQILNDPGLPAACRSSALQKEKDDLEAEVRQFQDHVEALRGEIPPPDPAKQACRYVEKIEKATLPARIASFVASFCRTGPSDATT
jgi:hypothetical protein